MAIFTYLFWPNLGTSTYNNPRVILLLILCLLLIAARFAIAMWRKKLQNPVTKRLSNSWASSSFWFGFVGLFLVVSRVEGISYISMRIWWIVWALALLLYLAFQVRRFRAKHYEKMPVEVVLDPRDKYLPKKKAAR